MHKCENIRAKKFLHLIEMQWLFLNLISEYKDDLYVYRNYATWKIHVILNMKFAKGVYKYIIVKS